MSPYKMSGTTVVSFSGGRTSAYMLRQVLDANDDLDDLIVTFASTGKEHPVTHDFVNECSLRWQVPIIWQEYRDDDRGFTIVTYETASRDGEPFAALVRKRSYLPNPVTRFCTIDLKIRVIHKYQGKLALVCQLTTVRSGRQSQTWIGAPTFATDKIARFSRSLVVPIFWPK
ncbi:hypothetical protein QNL75_11150 [Pseudomonas amygdali pv. morsprunorum]|uniref:Phosphoadenosine phosphosulphate reductase domain-containing protein n=2 Tax=Pseudomonas syringae group TaxID=136849 RepID=A0A2K4WUM5_PSESX|nr:MULTISPECIES: hypothetical protein [Pseudomonas syringae group]KPB59799.1 Phage-related protein [Pseudomonas amygdali pv. myricae]MDT3225031.1 hypothetical protein [Pseudomonas amygdali pv. morsprunorum]MDT3243107.1 hypothetical protein [Pseudomonas amygdali pv. morsprunorum]MDT3265684.1 hypothetical protein [Pseudomonas amygdali pv. morsprunorum]RMO19363.1 Phage-related protein [Pseudomonas amygdali pv. morsprunorum]